MDRISGYSQVSEIIPFDYSQPFLLFPVRHHSLTARGSSSEQL